MKIAVTSTGQTLDSTIDQRFGRAAYFIIIDTETMNFTVIENTNVDAAGGAGINSAKAVTDAGANAVLTGNCGPNAQRTLTAAGLQLYTNVTGTIAQAIQLFKNGRLTQTLEPNVNPHFGMDNSV